MTQPSAIIIGAASLIILSFSLLSSCDDDTNPQQENCESSSEPTVILGKGVGGAFVPYKKLEEVSLAVAPQGGFGVTVIVRTTGLVAGPGLTAKVQLNVEQDDKTTGEFLLEDVAFSCREQGGEIRGVVVGFDPQVYKSNDDLLALNGKTVDLVVTVKDASGGTGEIRHPVIIRLGT